MCSFSITHKTANSVGFSTLVNSYLPHQPPELLPRRRRRSCSVFEVRVEREVAEGLPGGLVAANILRREEKSKDFSSKAQYKLAFSKVFLLERQKFNGSFAPMTK